MAKSSALVALALGTLMAAPAWAGGRFPEPVCRISTVLEVMAREVQSRDYYARIDRSLITEQPGAGATLFRCGVWATTVVYNSSRCGAVSLVRRDFHEFAVQAVRHGFVVRFVR